MESDLSRGIRRWKPLLVVASCTGITMYTMANLFPYVGFMVASFSGEHADGAGYQAGYVASAFFLGRFIGSYPWGYLSDRFGRKPVMLISMGSIAIGSLFFGVSEGLLWAVTTRLLMGLTCAATTVGRALVPELCEASEMVGGMAYVTGSYAVGLTMGPAIGGLLSEPARHFPSLFPRGGFFDRYPYMLPNVVGAVGALICFLLVILIVPETKTRKGCLCRRIPVELPSTPVPATPKYKQATGAEYDLLDVGPIVTPSRRKITYRSPAPRRSITSPAKETLEVVGDGSLNESDILTDDPGVFGKGGLLQVPHVPRLLIVTCLMEIVNVGFDEVYPLWALSSRRAGGLNWSIMQIGQVLFVAGIGQISIMFLAYAWFVNWVGIEACHRGAGIVAVFLNAAVPLIGALPWSDPVLVMISVVNVGLLNCTALVLYTAVMVSATNPVPPYYRGRLAGIMTASQCVGGAVGPAMFAILFAWSISKTSSASNIYFIDQHFVFSLGAMIRVLALALVWKILVTDTMTDVAMDPPTPGSGGAPTIELEAIPQLDELEHESPTLKVGEKESNLV